MTRINGRRSAAVLATGIALATLGGLPADAGASAVAAEPAPVKLEPDLSANAEFGAAVAADGDTLVVGAYNDAGPGKSAGSVVVYVATDAGWTEQARLVPLHPQNSANFGRSVAIDGDTVVIGAPDRDADGLSHVGLTYVFVRSGTTWTEQARLETTLPERDSNSGWSVAVQGDVAAVGAPGALDETGVVEVFTRSGTTWTQQAVLEPSLGDGSDFGAALALDGETLVIGQSGNTALQQAAYVYVGSGSSWTEQAVLVPDGLVFYDYFGSSVDVSADTVVVGARGQTVDGVSSAGSAYVYAREGGVWSEQQKLTEGVPFDESRFGTGVSVDRDVIAVGAKPEVGRSYGTVYIFRRAGDTWMQRRQLLSPNVEFGEFGEAVDLVPSPSGGRTLAVGAPNERWSGAAYVYEW